MSDLTPGDPLGGGGPERPAGGPGGSAPARDRDREQRHESGLPMPSSSAPSGFSSPAPSGFSSPAPSGYSSPPPPGAGGMPMGMGGPKGTGGLRLAGWWRRAGAAVIDGFVIGIPALLIAAAFGVGFAGTESDAGIGALILASLVTALIVVVIAFIYAPLLMAKTNGQTFGRMATGIRVVRTDGQPMTFGWAMLREVAVKGLLINSFAGSVTFGLAILLNYLWPLWDDEKRALHDYLVQTRTVLA